MRQHGKGLVSIHKRKAGLRPAGTNNPRSTDYNQEIVDGTAYDSGPYVQNILLLTGS